MEGILVVLKPPTQGILEPILCMRLSIFIYIIYSCNFIEINFCTWLDESSKTYF